MINIIQRIPNLFLLVITFITTFLLSFLLLSCYDEADAYSGIYLTRLSFNKDQMLIVNFNSTTTSKDIDEFSLAVGYMNFCVDYKHKTTCALFSNIDKVKNYPLIAVDGDENTTIDLCKLAKRFNEVCFSYILIAALILVLFSLALIIWIILPLIPGKLWVRKILCIVGLVNVLTWGLGAMLQHEAVKSSSALIPLSSMSLIDVHPGTRAESVTWTAFCFLLVNLIGNLFLFYREYNITKEPIQNSTKEMPKDFSKNYYL